MKFVLGLVSGGHSAHICADEWGETLLAFLRGMWEMSTQKIGEVARDRPKSVQLTLSIR